MIFASIWGRRYEENLDLNVIVENFGLKIKMLV